MVREMVVLLLVRIKEGFHSYINFMSQSMKFSESLHLSKHGPLILLQDPYSKTLQQARS